MICGCVEETRSTTGWSLTRVLGVLQVSRSSYYRNSGVHAKPGDKDGVRPVHPDRILPSEREAVIDYARHHPDIRHRALAWKMVDEDVAFVSPSTVYRILVQAELICGWKSVATRVKRTRHHGMAQTKSGSRTSGM